MWIQGLNNSKRVAFSRNPIMVRAVWPAEYYNSRGGSTKIVVGGTDNIYEGRFFPPLAMNISEVIDSYVPYFAEPSYADIIECIENSDKFSEREVSVIADYDGTDKQTSFMVIPGGVSRQNWRLLYNRNSDIFRSRFLNYSSNFFLTTRSNSWRIVLKETELYPLYFLRIGNECSAITAKCLLTGDEVTVDLTQDGVYALNLDLLRRRFVEDYNVLPSVFDIYCAGTFACRIVVENTEPALERYSLKFRNSYGVFEVLDIVGELSYSSGNESDEDTEFYEYDGIVDDFTRSRYRLQNTKSATIDNFYLRNRDIPSFLDMLSSDDVYLIEDEQTSVKVFPSSDSFTYRSYQNIPQKYNLKLEFADKDSNVTQDICSPLDSSKHDIFSSQFDDKFN